MRTVTSQEKLIFEPQVDQIQISYSTPNMIGEPVAIGVSKIKATFPRAWS